MTVDATTRWLVVLGATVGTFALRISFLGATGVIQALPATVTRALRFLPAAVLAALALPAILGADGGVAVSAGHERLLAGAVGGGVAWYTESIFWTIGAGMAVFWLLQHGGL